MMPARFPLHVHVDHLLKGTATLVMLDNIRNFLIEGPRGLKSQFFTRLATVKMTVLGEKINPPSKNRRFDLQGLAYPLAQ
jgi:hypothetical protein